jgi:hypothetical protein
MRVIAAFIAALPLLPLKPSAPMAFLSNRVDIAEGVSNSTPQMQRYDIPGYGIVYAQPSCDLSTCTDTLSNSVYNGPYEQFGQAIMDTGAETNVEALPESFSTNDVAGYLFTSFAPEHYYTNVVTVSLGGQPFQCVTSPVVNQFFIGIDYANGSYGVVESDGRNMDGMPIPVPAATNDVVTVQTRNL